MKPHKIRSVFSNEVLYPPDWLDEMEKLNFEENDIIKNIETYELYLALIFGGLKYIHKDNELSDWSEKILKNAYSWLEINSQNEVFKENVNYLLKFMENNGCYFGISKGDTFMYYAAINSMIRYCFYPDGKDKKINIGKEICKNVNKEILKSKKDIITYCKDIEIFYFTDSEIVEFKFLIEYFIRTKIVLSEKYERRKSNKLPVKQGLFPPSININILEVIQYNLFNNDENDKQLIEGMTELINMYSKQLSEINEIKKSIHIELHYNKPLKLLFLHEHTNFSNVLEILISKGYIINDRDKNHYIWNYKGIIEKKKGELVKQDGNILLAFLLFDFSYIPKLKVEGKDLDGVRNNIRKIGKDFYTAQNFKAINLAFNMINKLENCGVADKNEIPRGYNELLEDIGLTNESNLIRPGLKQNTFNRNKKEKNI
jgi:hypothetical protein